MATNLEKKIEWKRFESKNSRFIFELYTSEVVTSEVYKTMVDFCNLNFGIGGHISLHDSNWFVSIRRDLFAFKSENDRLAFYIAFCG